MKNNLLFEFSVDKESNTIRVKREFAAKPPLVWEAWTTSELLDKWWAPKEWESNTKSMEFKEGGMRHYVMRGPASEEFWGITTYSKIKLHKSYSGDECFADENAKVNEEYPQSVYNIKFAENGNNTIIEHNTTYANLQQLEDSIQYGFEEGMLMAFEGLDALLDS